MGLSTVVLVLSALVLPTFGRDHAAHHFRNALKQQAPVNARDHTDSLTQDGRQNLQVHVNTVTNMLGFLNATVEIAGVFDINGGYLGLFYGSTGDVIVMNLETQVGRFARGNPSLRTWNSRSESFAAYFNSVRSFDGLFQYGFRHGRDYEPVDGSDELALLFHRTVNSLSRGEYSNPNTFFVSRAVVAALRGPLKGVLNIWGNGVFTVGVGSKTAIVRLASLGEIVTKIGAGVNFLTKIRFDWNAFFFEPSGIQLFINIFSKLVAHNIDCRPIIREYAIDFEAFLAAIGGNSTRGINGVMKCAVEYFRNIAYDTPNYQQLKKEAQEILVFLRKTGLAPEVRIAVNFFSGILRNYFIYKGVDVIYLIKHLFPKGGEPLHHLIRDLTGLRQVVKLESSVGLLLYYLTKLTVNGSVTDVRAVLPGVTIDESYNIRVPFIFRGAKLSSLQRNLYKFLLGRPVFSRILSIIDSAFAPSDRITLEEIFKSAEFARFGRIIKKVLAAAICAANGGQVGYETTGIQRQHKRIHHATGPEHNKHWLEKHLSGSGRHLEKNGQKHIRQQRHSKHYHKHARKHRYDRKKQDEHHKHKRRHLQ